MSFFTFQNADMDSAPLSPPSVSRAETERKTERRSRLDRVNSSLTNDIAADRRSKSNEEQEERTVLRTQFRSASTSKGSSRALIERSKSSRVAGSSSSFPWSKPRRKASLFVKRGERQQKQAIESVEATMHENDAAQNCSDIETGEYADFLAHQDRDMEALYDIPRMLMPEIQQQQLLTIQEKLRLQSTFGSHEAVSTLLSLFYAKAP